MSLALLKQSLSIIEDKGDAPKKSESSQQQSHEINTWKHESTEHRKKNVDDIKREINDASSNLNRNVKKLLALSKSKLKTTDAQKILKRTGKGDMLVKKKKEKAETSIFTEEDFAAFEREYIHTSF